jgi:hypothetical protein
MRVSMVRLRRLVLAVAVFGLLVPATAGAARPVGYPDTIATTHFIVHYTGDLLAPDRITAQTAGDIGQIAERAYSTLTASYGYPVPLDDGDAKVDIYVLDLGPALLGRATPEGSGNQLPGYIELSYAGGLNDHVIAHELFHLIQFAIFIPDDGWLLESTAEWMGFRFEGFPLGIDLSLAAPDLSLDCIGDKCGDSNYEIGGYSRWSFFEYLRQRYGSTIVADVFNRGATLGNPTIPGIQLVADTIAAKGSTLADVFVDWTVANLSGNYEALGLKGVPPVTATETATGTVAGPLPVQHIAVNHLAARYLAFTRGDGTSTGPCYEATLTVNVTYPAGIGAKPYFYWAGAGGSALALSGSAGSVSAALPWDTCAWDKAGYLVLQNPSMTADSQVFTVTASLSVDKTKPAVSTDPPKPANINGLPVGGPTDEGAPTLTVHAPELVMVSSKSKRLRLIVYSSGDGKLHATLGSLDLGTLALRAGNNDLRFVLPATAMKNLRSKTAGSNILRLTSLSPEGAEGSTVTRRVKITKPPAKKPAPKKPKRH